MNDSISHLTAQIRAFCQARDWEQFHSPKELALALSVEAGELLQHFVWQTPEQVPGRANDRRDAIGDEIAAAAELVMGKIDRVPVAIVRGVSYVATESSASTLIRPASKDLFR